jgi:hypothetical protein
MRNQVRINSYTTLRDLTFLVLEFSVTMGDQIAEHLDLYILTNFLV